MEQDQSQNINLDTEKLKKDLETLLVAANQEVEKIRNLSAGISAKAKEIELYYESFNPPIPRGSASGFLIGF